MVIKGRVNLWSEMEVRGSVPSSGEHVSVPEGWMRHGDNLEGWVLAAPWAGGRR